MEYPIAPPITNKSPSISSPAAVEAIFRENTKMQPPDMPSNKPIIFERVSDSRKKMAAKMVMVMGVVNISSAAWMGLVNDMPVIEKL